MKKKRTIIFGIICALLISGCASGKQMKHSGMYIYYINTEDGALKKIDYENEKETLERTVEDMLKELKKVPDSIGMEPAIPKDVEAESFEIKENCLEVHFNDAYKKMKKGREVLCRAAVVQTLVQIEGIDFVSFYVGSDVLKDKKGIPIGLMSAEDFVQNTGSSFQNYQITTLHLYFANEDGTKLVKETVDNVRYSSNTSVERLIVEQLIKGPSSGVGKATIPKESKILGVSVKDGICYVNLDSAFLSEGYNQKPEVTVYSIVNSIIEGGNANRVQILINGESDAVYKGSIKLDRPLEWNADMIEENEKQ